MRRPLFALALVALPLPLAAEEVVVFAAASLKTALDEVAADFTAATGHGVTISYAGSNALATQIMAGAPADIYISAAVNWMDEVEGAGFVIEGARGDLLGNTLVLVGPANAEAVMIDATLDLPALLDGGRLAMALVDAVPAGQYGKAALQSLGLWATVEPHVAQADNVRAALALVALGEAPYGIVYATDAAAEERVNIVGTFSADSHPEILYPAALLTGAMDEADRVFFEALSSDASAVTFSEHGFSVLQ